MAALPAVAPVATIAAMDDGRALPLVTVILSIRDEERRIRVCLMAALAQDYPADRLEILAVDGRSTDATRAIVAELAAATLHLSYSFGALWGLVRWAGRWRNP
jgi:cellulose synthase/poly-beta-1,6-N-acetylglucosamine synthase-like glycosyltransferase